MKKILGVAGIIALFMLLLPLGVMGNTYDTEKQRILETNGNGNILKAEKPVTVFRIYDTKNDKITEIESSEYIFGVLAAEMPASYEDEALKAQAVAAYTYACYKKEKNSGQKYDITTDYTIDQSYKTRQQAMEDWGSNAQKYADKIDKAIESVEGIMMQCDSKPILAVYHALSCGNTYSAKEVWGSDISYLQPVSSSGDKLSGDYISTATFTEDELTEKLSDVLDKKPDDSAEILGSFQRQDSGLVTEAKAWGEKITGGEIREALELKSCNFEMEKKDGKYTFTVYGSGHGVGMSQVGAEYMAEQGYTYDQILSHYYTGVKLYQP